MIYNQNNLLPEQSIGIEVDMLHKKENALKEAKMILEPEK